MLRAILAFVSLISAVTAATAPTPVANLNVTNYYGRWFQVYSDIAVIATFENNSYCVTADYAPNPNGTISVTNRERNYNVSGPERRILGWADTPNPAKPGELQVHLQTTQFGAPYWVLNLGPLVNGLYDYSVVSDNFQLTLFVLARNLTRFAALYDSTVRAFLKEAGFTTILNSPIPTIQQGCTYYRV